MCVIVYNVNHLHLSPLLAMCSRAKLPLRLMLRRPQLTHKCLLYKAYKYACIKNYISCSIQNDKHMTVLHPYTRVICYKKETQTYIDMHPCIHLLIALTCFLMTSPLTLILSLRILTSSACSDIVWFALYTHIKHNNINISENKYTEHKIKALITSISQSTYKIIGT